MRLTQVMLAKGFGGAERHFVELCAALLARGHVVQAICHRRFSRLPALRALPGLRVDTLNVLGNWDLLARAALRRRLAEFAPAVVHAHLARAALHAGAAARALGLPVVVKTHNYVDLRYYRRVDLFIATTEDQAAYLARHGVPEARIQVIPNFSALAPSAPRAPRPGPARVLAFGRFVPKKGFDLLLQAVATLAREGLEFSLCLGGEGPQRPALERLVRELALEARVSLPGWIEQVDEALRAADLFVLPSLDEPFGIAVLEAMASGTPILATRTQGPREVLDERTAFLVEPGDTAALAAGLRAALAAPEERLHRAGEALARFTERYAAEAVVPRIEALYRSLGA